MKKLLLHAAFISMASQVAYGDDTEIFTGLNNSGGGADTIFILDTSGSMAELEEQEGITYSSSTTYPSENYGFDPEAHYIFRENALDDLSNLSSAEINRIKEYKIDLNGYNCSRSKTLNSIEQQGYSTGKYAVFVPGIGWRGPDNRSGTNNQLWENDRPRVPYNSSVIIQCKEAGRYSEYNYTYNGVSYRGLADDDKYGDTGFPYTTNRWSWNQYPWDEGDENEGIYTEIYSGNYLNFLRYVAINNLGSQYKMRLDIVADAAKDVIAANDDPSKRFALMRFNYSGSNAQGAFVDVGLAPLSDISDKLNEALDSYDPAGFTPLTESLYESHLYFSENYVNYGSNPKIADLNGIYRGSNSEDATWTDPANQTFASNPGSYFSVSGYVEDDETDPEATENQAGSTYKLPQNGICGAPSQNVILFSDGLPTTDTGANNAIQNLVNSVLNSDYYTGDSPPPDCNKNVDGGCLSALAWYMSHQERRDNEGLPSLTVNTIGGFLGAGSNAETLLDEVADYGNGRYFAVSNEDEVKIAIAESLRKIDTSPSTFTAPAIAVSSYNSLQISDELYYAVFEPNDTGAWKGNLKRYRITNDGVVDSGGDIAVGEDGFFKTGAISYWSDTSDGADVKKGGVAERFADVERNVKIVNAAGNLVDATLDNITGLAGDPLGLEAEGITDNLFGTSDDITYELAVANWIAGKTPDGSSNRLEMEDAIHSRPVVVNYKEDRRIVYIGTNGGYLHAFDTKTGREVFSIVPHEVLTNARYYADSAATSADDKIYGLDGPITYWHDDKNLNGLVDGTDTVYLFVGMRRGGHSYYAFNITNPDSPSLLWQKHGAYLNDDKNIPAVSSGYERLGQTWSSLKPALVNWNGTPTVVLLAGGGYDPAEDGSSAERLVHTTGNTVYMIRASDGAVLWSALDESSDISANMTNSFASDVSPVDRDGDGFVDLLFAADTGGRVWRFDWKDDNQGFNGGVIADLNSSASDGVSGNRRFYVSPDVSYINTTRTTETDEGIELVTKDKFLLVSIGSGYRAHPLDEDVQDHFYLIKDPHGLNYPEGYETIQISDLVEWSSSDATDESKSAYGWYFDPTLVGEKVMSPSITLNGVVTFNTFSTTTDEEFSCSGNLGASRTYQFALSEEIRNRITCKDGTNSCKPDIPGETATYGDVIPRLKPDPSLITPEPDPCEEGEVCEEFSCEDYAIKILSGTTLTEGNMDRCDLFEASYWEEVR